MSFLAPKKAASRRHYSSEASNCFKNGVAVTFSCRNNATATPFLSFKTPFGLLECHGYAVFIMDIGNVLSKS